MSEEAPLSPPPPPPAAPPAQAPDSGLFTCGVIALWLAAGASAIWAFFIGLANTTTQGYAMSKKSILLAFGPGAVVFFLSIPMLLHGVKKRGLATPVILALLPAALAALLFLAMIVNLLGG